jgi:hypothetical protein
MAPRRKLDRFLPTDTIDHLRSHELASDPSNGWIAIKRVTFSYFNGYFPKEARTIEVPEFIQSVQTFQYLELTYDTAKKLFHRYVTYINKPGNEEVGILEFAKHHVSSVPGDARGRHDPWGEVMNEIGLNKEWKKLMWLSNWDGEKWHPRESSLKEEVLDMMETRFKELMALNGKIMDKYDEELYEREGIKIVKH